MFDFDMWLRHRALEAVEDQPPAQKAVFLNVIEQVIQGDMSVDELVDAIAEGTVPVTYRPLPELDADPPEKGESDV